MLTYGVFDPSIYVAPAVPITIYGIDHSIRYLRVQNNSPFQLSINLFGLVVTVSEFWQKDVPLPRYFQGTAILVPSVAILTASHSQASQLTLQGLLASESDGSLDSAIPQQAVTATASGNPLFTAHWEWGSTAGNVQTLNVYNPANSGVDMIFHAGKIMSNSAGVPQSLLTYITGADLNLSQAVPARAHTIQVNPPVSSAHVTSADDAGHGGTSIENSRAPGSVSNGTIDLIAFPDTITLKPGANLLLVCSDTTAGHVISLALKWSEQVSIPAPSLAGVPTLTAANIVNDNNATGTGIIEASTTAGQETFVTNDGLWLLKVLQSGVLHQFLKTQSAGNPLQLGQAGDTLELLGNMAIDGAITVNNGSVSGSVTFYTPIWGASLKILIIVFNNYQSAAAFTFNFPSSMANGVFMSGNYGAETVQFQLSGVAVASSLITALAGAGGTSAGSNTVPKNSIGTLGNSNINQAQASSNAAAVGQALVLIGV